MSTGDSRRLRRPVGVRPARATGVVAGFVFLAVLAFALAACGSSATTTASPSPSPTGPRVFTNDAPPFSVTLPSYMKQDPPHAPDLEGAESVESSTEFSATPLDNPELKGNVYLYVITRKWSEPESNAGVVEISRHMIAERFAKNLKLAGGKSETMTITAKSGLVGDVFMVRSGGGTSRASCGAVYTTSERFYVLLYSCDDLQDFAVPSIKAEFLQTLLSLAETT